MKKHPILTVNGRKVTYYKHPKTGHVHGMISIPLQFKASLAIGKETHLARLLRRTQYPTGIGIVGIFSRTQSSGRAYKYVDYDELVPVRVTSTNIFVKLPAKMLDKLHCGPQTHEVNWKLYRDLSLEGEIVPIHKI